MNQEIINKRVKGQITYLKRKNNELINRQVYVENEMNELIEKIHLLMHYLNKHYPIKNE